MNKKYNDPVRLSISLDRGNYEFLQACATADQRSVTETLNRIMTALREKEGGSASANPLDLLNP